MGYVLATAPAIQDRRAWEKELVRGYLAALAKAGGPTVSEDEAWEEIKFQSLTVVRLIGSYPLFFPPVPDLAFERLDGILDSNFTSFE